MQRPVFALTIGIAIKGRFTRSTGHEFCHGLARSTVDCRTYARFFGWFFFGQFIQTTTGNAALEKVYEIITFHIGRRGTAVESLFQGTNHLRQVKGKGSFPHGIVQECARPGTGHVGDGKGIHQIGGILRKFARRLVPCIRTSLFAILVDQVDKGVESLGMQVGRTTRKGFAMRACIAIHNLVRNHYYGCCRIGTVVPATAASRCRLRKRCFVESTRSDLASFERWR